MPLWPRLCQERERLCCRRILNSQDTFRSQDINVAMLHQRLTQARLQR